MNSSWVDSVLSMMEDFAREYSTTYSKKKRELSASFEIGCFLALVQYYEQSDCTVNIKNLGDDGEYRYLTTPSGNPRNFSYIEFKKGDDEFELRQQVRIRCSHIDNDIAFTPDIVILKKDTEIQAIKDSDYAKGNRCFYSVNVEEVLCAHECKSLSPFPELLISFLGMVFAAHSWLNELTDCSKVKEEGLHLAPTLFVGGFAKALHLRMVNSLKTNFPINIILGMHAGTWNLFGDSANITRVDLEE
ncbi:MAG: hypothetical protein NUK65_05820 [Firmicutes bacterium]|nr:hypothetical protein [Bacillota bacterium]